MQIDVTLTPAAKKARTELARYTSARPILAMGYGKATPDLANADQDLQELLACSASEGLPDDVIDEIVQSVPNFEAVKNIWAEQMTREYLLQMSKGQTRQRKRSPQEYFSEFLADLQKGEDNTIASGMPLFDKLTGMLQRQTLVLLGAAPSIGKTTFAQQLFESYARKGHKVIFLNYEMSRKQLYARSLARLAMLPDGWDAALSANDILRSSRWTEEQRRTVQAVAAEYATTTACNISYNPTGADPTITALREVLREALAESLASGEPAAMVVIDYLHLLQGERRQEVADTIKQAVAMLKDYAISGNTVAFAIIATNRNTNESGKMTLGSGRDSSALEYSADLFLGLNFSAWESGEQVRIEALQAETPRRVSLKVLKSRFGEVGNRLDMRFFSEAFDFVEDCIISGKTGLPISAQQTHTDNDAPKIRGRGGLNGRI